MFKSETQNLDGGKRNVSIGLKIFEKELLLWGMNENRDDIFEFECV